MPRGETIFAAQLSLAITLTAGELSERGTKFLSETLLGERRFGRHFKRQLVGLATTQNLVVKFDGEIRGRVLVEHASDEFPQQKKLENLLPNFAGSSPPISPKTSPTSLWKSLVLLFGRGQCESKIAARQWGLNSCREALRCLAGPSKDP